MSKSKGQEGKKSEKRLTVPTAPTEYAGEILEDGNHDWAGKKVDGMALADYYSMIDERKAARIRDCGKLLAFAVQPDGKKKLRSASFCRVRLCPMCQWRRTMKAYCQIKDIVNYLGEHNKDIRYIFVTLTVRNCPREKLRETLADMQKGWNRFRYFPEFNMKRKGSPILGYYKSTEVTHNTNKRSKYFNTYHPHFHVLYAVDNSYFGRNNAYYCNPERLKDIWAQCMGIVDPAYKQWLQVKIQAVRSYKFEDVDSAVCEMSKYSLKSKDYIMPDDWDFSCETVELLDFQLAGLRFLSMGGCFKDAHRALHLDDTETGDLVHLSGDELSDEDKALIWYAWHYGYSQYIGI